MKAILVSEPGDASKLVLGETETPTPSESQLLVKVHSFALNRMDVVQRQGSYPAPFGASQILGVEFAGTVSKIGGNADGWKEGERVFGLVYGGAYAEYVVIDKQMAMRIPDHISYQTAASLPEVWFTAYQALFLNCNLEEGENVLIHAGASGVGSVAIQIAKYIGKAKNIIVTVGTEDKKTFCKDLGATHAINYKTEDWPKEVEKITEGKGVNVIVDFVGATHWNGNLASLSLDGRMVMLAFLSGAVIKESNLALILRKRLTIRGSSLRSRELPYLRKLKNQLETQAFGPIFDNSLPLRSHIDKQFSWKDIQEAHRYLESNQSMGKIVINID
ncbi:NADPH:quinone reductase [Rhizoclosmatium globosum]|uniref:NADPH:quinone reductase n=1 Tax=Rhizoclosmatium globosum TaxID=329046 RepID=A0A1Y2CH31_9FUNG|nr:NADPH:quinone reductase [Rhizoclosmatium globosum]|eukprot:ORY45615.1 NADPH:quinone reductase [Rhizoclosmatium globosum]